MQELNAFEIDQVSGGGAPVVAVVVVVVAVVALVAIGMVDGWKEEAAKAEVNKKKEK